MIVGHGLRRRMVEGPPEPDASPCTEEVACRRYRCLGCGAILVVVPAGVGRAVRYSLAAIAWALALWSHDERSDAEVRTKTSTARRLGVNSLTRWRSLRRWTRGAEWLFGAVFDAAGTWRERAARVASFIAAHAPVPTHRVPADAFIGAAHCAPR
jgi:hypothetical protein